MNEELSMRNIILNLSTIENKKVNGKWNTKIWKPAHRYVVVKRRLLDDDVQTAWNVYGAANIVFGFFYHLENASTTRRTVSQLSGVQLDYRQLVVDDRRVFLWWHMANTGRLFFLFGVSIYCMVLFIKVCFQKKSALKIFSEKIKRHHEKSLCLFIKTELFYLTILNFCWYKLSPAFMLQK